MNIYSDRNAAKSSDLSSAWLGQHTYPHRPDLLSPEQRKGQIYPDLRQQFLGVTDALMNHLMHV